MCGSVASILVGNKPHRSRDINMDFLRSHVAAASFGLTGDSSWRRVQSRETSFLIADRCAPVGDKWESYNDELCEARHWAIGLAKGISLVARDGG
ncbi:hypothetical protein [Nitrobacter sp.]|uniref:hypothetical protein n=1 Tax=Nitrobacter sp. TaxID=29420 RepID=UPI0029CABA67|nr:hypothetical protein [Nitrobacter sp.]